MTSVHIMASENNNNVKANAPFWSSLYVSMDLPQRSKPSDSTDAKPKAAQDESFFWELVHFAGNRSWKKKVLSIGVIVVSLYVLVDLIFLDNVRAVIVVALDWMTIHPFGAVFSFLAFFVVATLMFVPPAILCFFAGYAFANMQGFWYGMLVSSIISFLGSCAGAVLAFLRSRYMMRDVVLLFAQRYPIVQALDRALEQNGFRVMVWLRLCPIIPFNGLNYIGGITSISLEDYSKALVGVIPTILLWTFSGASTNHLTNHESIEGAGPQLFGIILISTGFVFGIAGAVLIWKYSMEELKKEIDLDRVESWWKYKQDEVAEEDAVEIVVPVGGKIVRSSPQRASFRSNEGEEITVEAYERTRGILHRLGISANGLEGSFSGREDGKDEEWFWIWT